MGDKNKQELYNLSSQMMDLFIQDVFSKNEVDLKKAKTKISDEQRESLKKSVDHLKEQVETFIDRQNASKTITEDDAEAKSEPVSPLRERFAKRQKAKAEEDESDSEE